MNTILLLTTIFAVAVAVAAGIALFVAFREERRRSAARVALLRQMAGGADPADQIEAAPIDLGYLETYDNPASRPMFDDGDAGAPWGRRVAAAAVTAVIVGVAGYVLVPRSSSIASEAQTGSRISEAARVSGGAPLELLSLRHSHEEGRLVITGLVQNPRAGVQLTRVIATAFLFDAAGTLLASGRAPLDFSTLAAGDESPFVLTVPVDGAVSRYRVGFRSEDGRVIGHVDRRATGTLARTGE
jgi:hypothetical protein